MLDRIIFFSIKNKLLIGFSILILVIWGIYSLTQLPIDAVPDITNNQVLVITVAPSQSAQDIERLVTFPVEQTMSTIPGIEEIRSFSRFGLSIVTIVFKEGIDVYWARQQVSERLNQAKNGIPAGIGTPEMAPATTGLGEIYQYTLHVRPGYEKKYDVMQLRTLQDWIVRRQLLGTEGVAEVSSFGGYLKQYEIAINPDKLRSLNISINEIFTALQKNNQNTGGAYIDKKPNAYFIRSEGLISSIDDIEKIVIRTNSNHVPLLIRDIADVRLGHALRYGALTRNNNEEAVGGIVMMLKGANSSKVIANVKKRIAQIEKNLPEGISIKPFLDRTKLVNKAIATVTKNLAEGALIVIFVLVLLLGNLRAGFVVASVIPLAMLFAIAMMNLFGVSGNLMSLGAIDFGLIVDGAVIIVEATMHHMSLHRRTNRYSQQDMDAAVYQSASQIRNSAAFGEIIILIVYLPILALTGVEGKMFRPMAQTVSFAVLGAFLLSLTYVPMMSALLLSKKEGQKTGISDRIMGLLHRAYHRVIVFALRYKAGMTGSAILLFAASIGLFSQLGAEFIPTLDEGDFAVETRVLTGSSISETIAAAQQSAKVILDHFPEVKEVIGKIGSGEVPTDPMPIEACDLIFVLKDRSAWTSAKSREALADTMQQILQEHIPGVTYGFQQPIQMRFNELMTGARQDLVIKVYGEDLDQLTDYANRIGKIIATVKGAKDLYVEKITGLPQIVVQLDRDKLAQYGFNIESINQAINTAFAGQSAGFVYEGEKRFDLVVRLEQQSRKDIEDIKNLYLTAPDGHQVPLDQLADVSLTIGPAQIQRDNAQRRIIVGCNIRGRDVESIVNEIRKKIDMQIRFAPGYHTSVGGSFKNLQEARTRLGIAIPVALLLIFLLLFFTFHSVKQSLLIYTAIPLSAIGGIWALWLRGMPFSISAGVGFIALFGVAVLNGIVLIAEFNRLKQLGMTNLKAIVLKGTHTRLRPVIMTATVASLGFLPMALSGSEGAEVQRPLATVVIGGLITATLLTLVVLPCLYLYFEKIKLSRKKRSLLLAIPWVACLVPQWGQAQRANLPLDSAIQMAIQNNASIKSANLAIAYQQQRKRTASEIPKTEITLLYGQYNSLQRNDNHLAVTQTIPFPTIFAARNALGRAAIRSSEKKKAMTQSELVYQVKQVYYQLIFLQSRQILLQQEDSLFAELEQTTALQYETGEGTLLAKEVIRTQHNEINNKLRQNEADINIYAQQLQTLLNSENPVSILFKGAEERFFQWADDSTALAANATLAWLKEEISVAEKQKKLEIANILPTITAGYFNQSLIGFQNVNGDTKYFGPADRFQGWQLGMGIPLWWSPQIAKIKAVRIQEQLAQTQFDLYHRQLKGAFQQAMQAYLKSRNNLKYYKTAALPNATLILSQAKTAFEKGEISYTEYLINLQNALGIQENYLQALNLYNQKIITLEFLSGKNQ